MWLIVIFVSIVDNFVMDKRFIKKFAKNLTKIRKEKGMTQDDLAVSNKISRSTIGMIETAKTDITISKVKIIADALGVPPSKLFEFE